MLRFGKNYVAVSEVAMQFFCEKKVELMYLHGKVPKEEKIIGADGHEKLLEEAMIKPREEIMREIGSGKPIFVNEFFVYTKYNGIIIMGSIDRTFFAKKKPYYVFEYKFTKHWFNSPFPDVHVQGNLYCFLLDEVGFDTSELKYVLVLIDPRCKDCENLKNCESELTLQAILDRSYTHVCKDNKGLRSTIYRYNRERAIRELDRALEYWLNKRPAIPTSKPFKCKTCEYRDVCPEKLDEVFFR